MLGSWVCLVLGAWLVPGAWLMPGAWLAQRLHAALNIASPLGALNINFYRDDFAQSGLHTLDRASHIPVDINARDVILVDDILYTGRTIRAAMNELFDYGRPKSITLVCLIARDGRELPIQPDFIGLTLKEVPADHRVNVRMTEADGRDEIVVEPRG